MRKLMWLLSAMTLAASAVQAQFGQPYDPRPGGSNVPGIGGRRGPFGPPIPAFPTLPDVYDPLAGLRPPFTPVGRMPRMPPTLQDILNPRGIGDRNLRRRLDPLDPQNLIDGSTGGPDRNPPIPGVGIDPIVPSTNLPTIGTLQLDPKLLEFSRPFPSLKDLEAKVLAKRGGSGPPAWLGWEYAAAVFAFSAVVGLLNALGKRRISES